MAKPKRILFNLECSICKSRSYTTSKNPDNTKDKIILKKFCKLCRKVTEQKEVKI